MDDDEEVLDRIVTDGDEGGCLFPGKCCMPGLHLKSECMTAEMYEQYAMECGE